MLSTAELLEAGWHYNISNTFLFITRTVLSHVTRCVLLLVRVNYSYLDTTFILNTYWTNIIHREWNAKTKSKWSQNFSAYRCLKKHDKLCPCCCYYHYKYNFCCYYYYSCYYLRHLHSHQIVIYYFIKKPNLYKYGKSRIKHCKRTSYACRGSLVLI